MSKEPPRLTPWGQPLPPPPPTTGSRKKKSFAISSAKLQAYDSGLGTLKKTPFQLKKEAEEEKRIKAEKEAAAALAEYESSFGEEDVKLQFKTAPAFVKSGSIPLSSASPGMKTTLYSYTPTPPISKPLSSFTTTTPAKKLTIQLNSSKTFQSSNGPSTNASIPGLSGTSAAVQKFSLSGYSSNLQASSQIPLKRSFPGFSQEEIPVKQRQQASGRTAEDPRKVKWRAAYLASQEEEEREEAEVFNPGKSLDEKMDPENSTHRNEETEKDLFEDSMTLKMEALPQDISEESLCRELAIYGPIASVKLDSEGGTGLVAFMRPQDATTARDNITILFGSMIYVSKGRPIILPRDCLYDAVPAKTDTGLAFSAQPSASGDGKPKIIVTIPQDRKVLALIHLTISHVIEKGSGFEEALLRREQGKTRFEFLWNYSSPEHVYYRWKLYSLLQGDSVHDWHRDTFELYERGPLWVPPPLQFWEASEELLDEDSDSDESDTSDVSSVSSFRSDEDYDELEEQFAEKLPKRLPFRQRTQFQRLLQRLTTRRSSIAEALVFCMIHSFGAEDLIELVVQSLLRPDTQLIPTKLARFYLLSDLLYNSANAKTNVWRFRALLEPRLTSIFTHLGQVSRTIPGRLRQDQFRQVFMAALEAWEDWALFSRETLVLLEEAYQSGATREESFHSRLETQKRDLVGFYDPSYISQDLEDAKKGNPEEDEEATYARAFKRTTSAWVSIDADSAPKTELPVTLETLAAMETVPPHPGGEEIGDLDGVPLTRPPSIQDEEEENLDGVPLSRPIDDDDEDLDGIPLIRPPQTEDEQEEDLDGIPLIRPPHAEEEEDLDGIPFTKSASAETLDATPFIKVSLTRKESHTPFQGVPLKRWKGRLDLSTASDDESQE